MNTLRKTALAVLLVSTTQSATAAIPGWPYPKPTTQPERSAEECAAARRVESQPAFDAIRKSWRRKAGDDVAGRVVVRVLVEDNGIPFDAHFVTSSRDRALDQLLIEHARQTRYVAAPGCPIWTKDVRYQLQD
ncbi:hypothetical protein LF41_3041 [Lysobacter dokdonensis DS-58]|uniref:TonB family protein n=1 Tax=Lysobacter dokdonensis DS-58 TaxID=1300345 RepID=A0A0A2WGS6_9GAMM|nr:hypothetical protein [Lysobacter dokdonensis]KGQ19391.1 hypothetical protein LF41_3041 [Lysobacter dokdonensis DS-58]